MRMMGMIGVVLAVLVGGIVRADCPPCGPDFCLNDPRYPPALAAKKANMRTAGYPDDLIRLLDRDAACVARVRTAPDTFTILSVESGRNSTIPWDANEERIANQQLLDGRTLAYYKFNVRRAFKCCNQLAPEDRPDWDGDLGLSRSLAIKCTKQGAAVQCR